MTDALAFTRPRVSFVLPSYNEETNIVRVLDETVCAARRLCSEFEIVVVDDGSIDRTAELVRQASAQEPSIKLVSHAMNRGYGEALRSGFRETSLDYVFFTDADNQFDINEVGLLLAWAEKADVVAGYRKVRRDPFIRRVNAWGWNRIVRWLFYVPIRDIDCAFKLFRRRALQQIDIESRGAMINTEIMVKLARSGCTIVEVGVSHFPRTSGNPQGAKLRVIARALRELRKMYPHLSSLSTHQPDFSTNGNGAVRDPLVATSPRQPEAAVATGRGTSRSNGGPSSSPTRQVGSKKTVTVANGAPRQVGVNKVDEAGTMTVRAQKDEHPDRARSEGPTERGATFR